MFVLVGSFYAGLKEATRMSFLVTLVTHISSETIDEDNVKATVDDNVCDNVETSALGEVRQRAPLGTLSASASSHQNTTWVHSVPYQ